METGVGKMKEKMLEYQRLLSKEEVKTEELRSENLTLRSTIVAKDQEIDSLNARLTELSEILQKSQELLAQVGAHHDNMRKISNGPSKILHPIQESQDQSRQPASQTGNNKRMTRSTSQSTPLKQPPKPGLPKSVPSTKSRPTSPQKGQHPGSKGTGRAKPFKTSSPSKTQSK